MRRLSGGPDGHLAHPFDHPLVPTRARLSQTEKETASLRLDSRDLETNTTDKEQSHLKRRSRLRGAGHLPDQFGVQLESPLHASSSRRWELNKSLGVQFEGRTVKLRWGAISQMGAHTETSAHTILADPDPAADHHLDPRSVKPDSHIRPLT